MRAPPRPGSGERARGAHHGSQHTREDIEEPSAESFKAIAAGLFHTCGIQSDDKVTCWGDDSHGEAPEEPSMDAFKVIAAGSYYTCAIRSDDKLLCWGSNDHGQAPEGPSTDSFKTIAVYYEHTCGIRSDDKMVCWGDNSSGKAPPLPSSWPSPWLYSAARPLNFATQSPSQPWR